MMLMFKNKLFYRVLIVVFSAILIYSIVDFVMFKNWRNKEKIELGSEKLSKAEFQIHKLLIEIENTTKEFVNLLSENKYTKIELQGLIKEYSLKHKIALGYSVSYEPYQFDEDIKLFSIYYDTHKREIIDISKLYDYTDNSLETSVWYTAVIESGKAMWTKPYLEVGAKQYVIDYGIPFRIKGQEQDSIFSGVISLTMSLSDISKAVNKIGLGFSGYAVIMDRSRNIIVHPSSKLLAKNEITKGFVKGAQNSIRLNDEESGYFSFISEYTYEESLMFFSLLDNTNAFLGLVFTEGDLVPHNNDELRVIINIALILTLIIIFVLVLVLKIFEGKTRNLWYFSTSIAILFLINISIIWYMNVSMVEVREDLYKQRIITKTDLNSYLVERNIELARFGYLKSAEIPTGIYIEDIDFNNAYDISFRGKIWQRINDSIKTNHSINFVFSQKLSKGISVRTNLISKERVDNSWLYLYDFTTILNLDFSYSKFPLDFRMLNIQLMYPDIHDNIILVPDLESYSKINPKLKPGIDKEIYLPGERITSSYFSFSSIDYSSNLGNTNYKGPSHTAVLEFNILVKRILVNALIANILPILVISLMIFLLSFTLHKEDGELIEGSALSVIQASGGFLFILLLAHTHLRSTFETPDITYLETFYFIMYFFVSLVSTAILLYVKTDRFDFLEYKHNLIVKVGFWPTLLITIYIATIIMVY